MSTQKSDGDYDFNLVQLDGQCRDILKTIRDCGGTASSKQLKADAGVDKNQLHYRLDDVLEPAGLVETYTAKPQSGGKRLKHASFTENGELAIQKGLLEDILDANTGLRQIQRDIDELADRLEGKADRRQLVWDIDELRDKITHLQGRIKEIDSQDALESLEDRLETVEEQASSLEDTANRLHGQIDDVDSAKADSDTVTRLDESLTEHVDELEQAISEADTRQNLVALAQVVRSLEEQLAEQDRTSEVSKLSQRLSRVSNKAAHQEDLDKLRNDVDSNRDKLSDAATKSTVNRVTNRTSAIEERLDSLEEDVEANSAQLAENTEYSEMTLGDKRSYWLEKATDRINELNCRHTRQASYATPKDEQKKKILAHLDDAELQLIEEEQVFDRHITRTAKFSQIPGPCRHGWLKYKLFFWYY